MSLVGGALAVATGQIRLGDDDELGSCSNESATQCASGHMHEAGGKPCERACVGLDVVGDIVLREDLADPCGQTAAVGHHERVPTLVRPASQVRHHMLGVPAKGIDVDGLDGEMLAVIGLQVVLGEIGQLRRR